MDFPEPGAEFHCAVSRESLYLPAVPKVVFTSNLFRHVPVSEMEVAGHTVGEALREAFARYPALRSYVVDDQGAVRKHVAVFVDGEFVGDRTGLSDRVGEASEVFIMQALSGG